MTKTTNPLRLVLEGVLGKAGFSRKGDSWYRVNNDVVEVVNLQKSQFGMQFYLNYAIWIRALGDAPFPKEEKCHVRMRIDTVVSNADRLARFLDLEAVVPEMERTAGLTEMLSSELLPFAKRCSSLSGLHDVLAAGQLKKAMVSAGARRILADGPTPAT